MVERMNLKGRLQWNWLGKARLPCQKGKRCQILNAYALGS